MNYARPAFVVLFALAILAAPLGAEGQRAQKIHRVGVLTGFPRPPSAPVAF